MDIQQYLKQSFTHFAEYTLSEDDKKIAGRNIDHFILQKLFRKRFRKQKLFPNTVADITKKVALSLKENRPIYFTIPFGGYKHFWSTSHPEPDWAEFFTLKFLSEYVSPILSVYKPGVIVEFISEDLIIPRMNNYPEEKLEKYSEAFILLLQAYNKYLPNNLNFRFFRVSDRCNKEQIIKKVETLLPERWAKWEVYTQEEKDIELKRSKRSILWNGKLDLTRLSEKEKQTKMIESRLIELAYYDVESEPDFLGNYLTADNHIGVCFSFGLSPDNFDHWITLGSTYASIVDFWIGKGILEKNQDTYVHRIVSKEQYGKLNNFIHAIPTNFTLVSIRNYQTIDVIQSTDWTKAMD
jgi:hypothetical protein